MTEAFVSVPWTGPDDAVRALARVLRESKIQVSALGGETAWARTPDLAVAWAERAHAEGLFTGSHLDIEPWTCPDWTDHADALLAGIGTAVERVARSTVAPVDVDLTPVLGRTHPAGLAAIAHRADAVTLMSYRDTASGILEFSADARRVLTTTGRPFRLAVDTLPSPDPHTTFAGQPAADLHRETARSARRLADDRCFAGFAVHDIAGWRALPE